MASRRVELNTPKRISRHAVSSVRAVVPVTVSLDGGLPRLKPLAQIIALLMVAGGAQASQPFSAAWFAAKGAQQSAGAARPGAQLPGMTPPPLAQQQKVNQQLQRSLQNLNNTVAAIAAQQAAQAAGRQASWRRRRTSRTAWARAA